MFKFRKPKLVQNVIRVEDLQVGDVMQCDLSTQATVESMIQLNSSEFWIRLNDITPGTCIDDTITATLHRDLKLFVWR